MADGANNELPTYGDEGLDSAVGSFMSQWSINPDADDDQPSDDEGKKKPVKADKTPAEGDTDDAADEPKDDAEEPSDEGEEEAEGEEEEGSERKYGDDETYVKVTVGDEEHEVPVKDLKRLWGQEAALTRKGQEVAEARKTADAEQQKAVASLNVMLQRASERANQYRQIDFLTVARDLSPEEINVLRTNAQAAFEEEKFLKEELNGFMGHITQRQAETAQQEAKDCIAQLTDPTNSSYIEGWNQQLYGDLLKFAVDNGMPQSAANAIRIPGAFKLIHMAMKYAAGQKALTKTVKTKNKAPKKIVKASKAPQRTSSASNKVVEATEKLRRSGSTDDAANVFLARAEATQN